MEITSGKILSAQKCCIYGPEGIGKSTFASEFPEPLFIDTEGSTKHMDVKRLPAPSSWSMIMDEIRYVKAHPGLCKTLVIDTADWAERLCIEHICAGAKKSGIEDFGYGKGYIYLEEEFGRMLNLLNDCVDAGTHVVITAHAQMRKFEQPDELGSYDRWELKLEKKTAPLLKEFSDMLLFANYKTLVVNVDGQGATKGKNKAQGGKRVMYTVHHPAWDAKNRHGLADELPLDFGAISEHFVSLQPSQVQTSPSAPVKVDDFDKPAEAISPPSQKADEASLPESIPREVEQIFRDETGPFKQLADLMRGKMVSRQQLQRVVFQRGYYPESTPPENYDLEFVAGVLIGAWDQVYSLIQKNIDKDVPF